MQYHRNSSSGNLWKSQDWLPVLLLYLCRIGGLHMPSLLCRAHLWPGCCCWPYRRDSCVGYGCDGSGMVRLDGGGDGWMEKYNLSAKWHIASVALSKVLWAAPNNSLLNKSTSKCFPWKYCLFAAKMVHYWRPPPSFFGCHQKNSLWCTRCTETFIAYFCTVTMWGWVFCSVKGWYLRNHILPLQTRVTRLTLRMKCYVAICSH